MKTLQEIKTSIDEILIDMAIYSPTPNNIFRYISNMGAVIRELIGYCERLQENNLKYRLNKLYGSTIKDSEFSYADTDSIHHETKVLKYTPKELAELFLKDAQHIYRLCPDDIKGKICATIMNKDINTCVECWACWLELNCKGEN